MTAGSEGGIKAIRLLAWRIPSTAPSGKFFPWGYPNEIIPHPAKHNQSTNNKNVVGNPTVSLPFQYLFSGIRKFETPRVAWEPRISQGSKRPTPVERLLSYQSFTIDRNTLSKLQSVPNTITTTSANNIQCQCWHGRCFVLMFHIRPHLR